MVIDHRKAWNKNEIKQGMKQTISCLHWTKRGRRVPNKAKVLTLFQCTSNVVHAWHPRKSHFFHNKGTARTLLGVPYIIITTWWQTKTSLSTLFNQRQMTMHQVMLDNGRDLSFQNYFWMTQIIPHLAHVLKKWDYCTDRILLLIDLVLHFKDRGFQLQTDCSLFIHNMIS